MTKNPLVNALAAASYIILVSLVMFYGTQLKVGQNALIAPIALISLFTFSAAVMGYLFFYQPFQLYFDSKKKAALDLFLQTLACFGIVTFIALVLLFSRPF